MLDLVRNQLHHDETILATVNGMLESYRTKITAVAVATNERIIVCESTGRNSGICESYSYDAISSVSLYRDLLNFGLTKTLHLQTNDGNLIRLNWARDNDNTFVGTVSKRISTTH